MSVIERFQKHYLISMLGRLPVVSRGRNGERRLYYVDLLDVRGTWVDVAVSSMD